jgi:hypothetical protein
MRVRSLRLPLLLPVLPVFLPACAPAQPTAPDSHRPHCHLILFVWIALVLTACSASKPPEGTVWESTPDEIARLIDELDGDDTLLREKAFLVLKASDPIVSVPMLKQSLKTPKSGVGYSQIHELIAALTGVKEPVTWTGLRWLARHQSPDGHWDAEEFHTECGKIIRGVCDGPGKKEHNIGVTGLALLAFLGAEYSHVSRDCFDDIIFGQTIKKALLWLIANQNADGCFSDKRAPNYMYDNAVATLAVAEVYCCTGSPLFKEPAQKGIRYLVATQSPGGGWGQGVPGGDSDTSITGWCVMALRSAEMSGLDVPRSAFEKAKAWLKEATGVDFRVKHGGSNKDRHSVQEEWATHETMTAIGIWSRIFIDKQRNDPCLKGGADLLFKDLPVWKPNKLDYYYWHHASMALFQYDGPAGPYWEAWREDLKNTLVPNEKRTSDNCAWGSWDPIDRWSREGGRVYATAINLLTLQLCYKYR